MPNRRFGFGHDLGLRMGRAPSKGAVPTPVGFSASVRAKVPVSAGIANATVALLYYRSIHKTNKATSTIRGVFWHGVVNASAGNAAWEQGSGYSDTIQGAVLTGISGTALNQVSATAHPFTFFGLQAGTGEIRDLSWVTRTWAEFVAEGGSVSGDGRTVTRPSGWAVGHDPLAITLAAGERFAYQIEHGVPGASTGTPIPCTRGGPVVPTTSIGDASKNGGTATTTIIAADGKRLCDTTNWASPNVSGAGLIGGGGYVGSPVVVWGSDPTGTTKTVGIDGDSIVDENFDRVADADGCSCGITRALNAAGYSFVKVTAFSSSMTNRRAYGGDAVRLGLLGQCSAVITNHGHNDAGGLTTDANVKTLIRWHDDAMRAAMKPGSARTVIRMTLTPTTPSASQYSTPSTGWAPTDSIWTVYDAYLRRTGPYAGVPFDTAAGDPDAFLDQFAAFGANSATKAWAAQADTNDGTHGSPTGNATAAAYYTPERLFEVLGF